MAFVTGVTMNIQIDNAGGTLQDLSAYANSVDFGFPRDMLDTTTFGSTQKTSMPGFGGGDDIAIAFRYDPTVESHLNGLATLTTTTTVQIAPSGTATGKEKYSFETYLMNYPIKATPEGIDEITATFRKTGAYSRGTF